MKRIEAKALSFFVGGMPAGVKVRVRIMWVKRQEEQKALGDGVWICAGLAGK